MKKKSISFLIPNNSKSNNYSHPTLIRLLIIIGFHFFFQSTSVAQEVNSTKLSPKTKEAKVWHISSHIGYGFWPNYERIPMIGKSYYSKDPSSGRYSDINIKYFPSKRFGVGFKATLYSSFEEFYISEHYYNPYADYNYFVKFERDYYLFFIGPEFCLKQPITHFLYAYQDIGLGLGIFEDLSETEYSTGYSINAGLDFFIIKDVALNLQAGYFGISKPITHLQPIQGNIFNLSIGLKITPGKGTSK